MLAMATPACRNLWRRAALGLSIAASSPYRRGLFSRGSEKLGAAEGERSRAATIRRQSGWHMGVGDNRARGDFVR